MPMEVHIDIQINVNKKLKLWWGGDCKIVETVTQLLHKVTYRRMLNKKHIYNTVVPVHL